MPITAQATGIKAGAIADFAGSVAPAGWLIADGSAISRTLYSALFAYCGTTHGVGDGTTTFNIPDCRGEFRRGLDNGRGVDTGRTLGSAQAAGLPNITGALTGDWKYTGTAARSGAMTLNAYTGAGNYTSGSGTRAGFGIDASLSNPIYGASNTVQPQNKAFLTCIKF